MLVGRSLEINGNVYSRLMIEVPIYRETEPGLQVCIFKRLSFQQYLFLVPEKGILVNTVPISAKT